MANNNVNEKFLDILEELEKNDYVKVPQAKALKEAGLKEVNTQLEALWKEMLRSNLNPDRADYHRNAARNHAEKLYKTVSMDYSDFVWDDLNRLFAIRAAKAKGSETKNFVYKSMLVFKKDFYRYAVAMIEESPVLQVKKSDEKRLTKANAGKGKNGNCKTVKVSNEQIIAMKEMTTEERAALFEKLFEAMEAA